MNATLIIMLAQVILAQGFVTAILALMPRFMRPDVFFSVTVPPGFAQSDEGRLISKQYAQRVVLAGLGIAVLLLALFPVMGDIGRALSGVVGMLILIAVTTWAFISARRRTLPHAETPSGVREAGLAPRTLPLHRPLLAIGPFLIIAAAVAFLAIRYDSLPDRIPMHYNAAGEVDRIAAKSPKAVFAMPLIATLVCLMATALAWSMGRGLKVSRATGPTAERETRMLTLTITILLAVQYLIAMLFSSLSVVVVLPPEVSGRWVPILCIAAVIVMPILLIFLLLRYRSVAGPSPAAAGAAPLGDGTPDANWKWGLIYYNPDDPALWVEKRFGIGYTTNMAHPGAWAILGGILLFLVAIVLVAMWAGK